MIYLVGVSHSFQVCAAKPFREGGLENYGSRGLAMRFEAYLGNVIHQLKPQVVCEEYDEEQLCAQLTVDDRAYLVAKRLCFGRPDVTHMFCDPDQSQRNALYAQSGISEAEDAQNGFPLREREWLRRLEALLPNKSIVFICGANHISTFRQALSARGIATSIICEDFESAFAHN